MKNKKKSQKTGTGRVSVPQSDINLIAQQEAQMHESRMMDKERYNTLSDRQYFKSQEQKDRAAMNAANMKHSEKETGAFLSGAKYGAYQVASKRKRRKFEREGYSFLPNYGRLGNDFAWWNKYPELSADVLGLRPNVLAGTNIYDNVTIPGLVKYKMIDMYGYDSSATDPFNVSIRDLFLRMFQKYRGISQYQSADLGIVVICGIEIIKMIAQFERLYGIVNKYSIENYNLPYTVLAAFGLNDNQRNTIVSNLSKFRSDLNNIISKAQRICIPKDMSILADKIAHYGYLYKDHESNRSQIIMFEPKYYGVFDETTFSTGSAIKFQQFENLSSLINYDLTSTFFPELDRMVETLMQSESVQRIYGDLLAWFGADQLITPLTLTEDYVIEPAYAESICHKVHNIDILALEHRDESNIDHHISPEVSPILASGLADGDKINFERAIDTETAIDRTYWIYQVNNVIHTKAVLYYSLSGSNILQGSTIDGSYLTLPSPSTTIIHALGNKVLDGARTPWNDEFVCEGLLWKPNLYYDHDTYPAYDGVGNTEQSNALVIRACGPEICAEATVYSRNSQGTVVPTSIYSNIYHTNTDRLFRSFALSNVFSWNPIVYIVNPSDLRSGYLPEASIEAVYAELDTFRLVSVLDITRLLRVIQLSAFKTDIRVIDGYNQ